MSKFSKHSRYALYSERYKVKNEDGEEMTFASAPRIPLMRNRGRHLNEKPLRIDLLADHYLGASTDYWRIVGHNRALSADAVMALKEIRIPVKGDG